MIEFNTDQKQLRICIPVSNLRVIYKYHQSIINLLDKIEIDDCNPELRENLNAIYDLLSHLQPDEDFLAQYKELLKKGSIEEHKNVMA
jgi:hypothetical protein